MTLTRITSRCLVLAALALVAGCAQPQVEDVPLSGTLSDNDNPSSPTDSVYGTPPDPIPTVPPPPATASPTGREPRLIWTPERQATWDRMVAENHPLYQVVVHKCDRARNGNPQYGDRGLWCTLIYQMTGDVTAARVAWSIAGPSITAPPPNDNTIREDFIENVVMFDWLYPALTPAERDQAIEGINAWARQSLAIGTPQYTGGLRTTDSDRVIGFYFGLASADLATVGMSNHVAWLDAIQTGGPGYLPVGGLTATAVDRSTARNTIAQFVAGPASGGQWIESSDYDLGTMVLLLMGVESVRTAAGGSDPFPELQPFFREAIEFNRRIISPDLAEAVQWGDDERPRQFLNRLYKRMAMLGMLAAATSGSIESAEAMGLMDAFFQRYGFEGYGSAEPAARLLLTYDPYAPRAAWQPSGGHLASGMGQLAVQSFGSMFSGWMANRTAVDHEVAFLSDFQLYRNGEWAITHPIAYGGPAREGEGVNGLLTAGLSSMAVRGLERYQTGQGWWAITGSTGGPYYGSSYYNPPPAFLSRWRRTTVFLQRNGVDHVVTVDWIDMQDPHSLPRYDRYRTEDQARINGATGLVEWIIHAPVAPTAIGNTYHWQTPGGQTVTVTPVGYSPIPHVLDENLIWAGDTHVSTAERKWQLRLVPQFTGGTTVLRNVVSVGETNPQVSLSGDTITIDGAQVTVTETGVQVIG